MLYSLRPCVVGGQSESKVFLIASQQHFQVINSPFDIFLRIVWIADAQIISGLGGDLHQSHCSARRDRLGIIIAFHRHNRMDEKGV